MVIAARVPRATDRPAVPQRRALTIVPPLAHDTDPEHTPRPIVVTWVVAVPSGIVAMSFLGVAGYLLGSSALGAAIATGIVIVAVLVLVALWLATRVRGVHCPGCADC